MKRFIKQPDGHFLDTKTGLVWKERPEPGSFTWNEAKELETEGWRLPTIEELMGIVTKKQHKEGFSKLPNMVPAAFWSSSPYASNSNAAWIVGFGYGGDDPGRKSNNFAVRMVKRFIQQNPSEICCPVCGYYCLGKGGIYCIDKPSLVDSYPKSLEKQLANQWRGTKEEIEGDIEMSRFIQQEDGHFLDSKTGLVWKEHPEKGNYTWHEAKVLENKDWRLPTFEELKGILSKKRYNNACTKLPNMPPYWFWSSSPYTSDSNYAWIVNFNYGYEGTNYKISKRTVRLVKR
jgi:hypothetical protein